MRRRGAFFVLALQLAAALAQNALPVNGVGSTPAQSDSVSADAYSFLLWQMKKRQLAAQ